MDKDKTGQIGVDDVSTLLQNLGVYVPEEEVPGLVRTLDPSSSGFIKFEPMAAWLATEKMPTLTIFFPSFVFFSLQTSLYFSSLLLTCLKK